VSRVPEPQTPYDAILVVSFGGPEGPDDVLPFLENVLRGRNVPRERLLEVAEHYQHFGGVSPLNAQNRALIQALSAELDVHGPRLPIYFGNRNWHPLLSDTIAQMTRDGVRRAIAFFTSAYSSYSGCRQYRENVTQAQQLAGAAAPQIDKLRVFYNHPGFIEPTADRVAQALAKLPVERRGSALLLYTAHSIPTSMAENSRYVEQLEETARLVSEKLSHADWRLVYQSRSGPPGQPWLGPDICDCLREIAAENRERDIVIAPIGFLSDHVEVLFDLDTQAQSVCEELGLNMVRAATVGTHPRFVSMIRELLVERITGDAVRPAVGRFAASHDVCPVDCCLPPVRGGPAAKSKAD